MEDRKYRTINQWNADMRMRRNTDGAHVKSTHAYGKRITVKLPHAQKLGGSDDFHADRNRSA
jgi:hypothetical protein